MKEYNIKYSFNSILYKVRNVKLIYTNDPKFIEYTKNIVIKKRNLKKYDRDDSLRKYEKISSLFEKCIFHLAKSSEKRIIYWEEYNSGYWNERYLELDIVIEKDNKLIIGEVKTKYDILQESKLKLFKRNSLLKCITNNIDYYYIRIILNKNLEKNLSNKNINEIDFFKIETEDYSYYNANILIKKMTLKAEEVFLYGLINNIIYDDNFLNNVYDEWYIRFRELNREIELCDLVKLKEKFNVKI